MPILLLKEILSFYKDHGSNIFVSFIDASKAFDRVNYVPLFNKLILRKTPSYIVRLLINWYTNQTAAVSWATILSASCNVCNGVRQGGVLSPVLFSIYIDDLSVSLSSTTAGCLLGRSLISHFFYADDVVLFAPSAKGLQRLLDVCSDYAFKHDIIFNAQKSQCLVVRSDRLQYCTAVFFLSSVPLEFTEQYKYLGHIISADLSDDALPPLTCLQNVVLSLRFARF